jgi:CBS domain-containing protein
VAWTRGPGCFELASLLSRESPIAVESDPRRTCIDERADCLVGKKLTSFDLVPVVIPKDVDLTRVESVTAAVGDGPHSPFAVSVAARLGSRLDIPAVVATAYHETEGRHIAEARLARLAEPVTEPVESMAVEAERAADMVEALPDTTLLVIGAPGGSWFYRHIYGPGHRLAVAAPNGSIAVRSAPRRCFHEASSAAGHVIGVHLSIADARHVIGSAAAPVTDEGQLVGIVRRAVLLAADDGASIDEIMEPPVAVEATEPLANAEDLSLFLDGGPIPVVDDDGTLIGVLSG